MMRSTRTNTWVLGLMLWQVFVFQSSAQACGTVLTQAQIDYELTLPATQAHQPLKKRNVTLSITAWEAQYDSLHFNALTNAIEQLNSHFAPIGIQFILCDYKLIPNSNYWNLTQTNKEELLTLYQAPNTINLYLLESIEGGYAGFTFYPTSQKDLVFLRATSLSDNMLTHQLGHFLGLYHTHETAFGEELADQSNCESAGDRLCDTPADPNLADKVVNCQYIGTVTDASGDYYLPTVSNFMNFADAVCRCFFTPEQYTKMLQTYVSHKQHLK